MGGSNFQGVILSCLGGIVSGGGGNFPGVIDQGIIVLIVRP